jgi:predicted lysophospholipase L1 biosynthesis ABC-type transport system permease subunit
MTIVGVAGDVRHEAIAATAGFSVYAADAQYPDTWTHFVMRVHGDPLSAAEPAKAAVWSINPDQPVTELAPLARLALDTAWRQRAAALLLAGFSLLALGLAAVGVYAVTSHTVAQRTREIGVRMAFGARPRDILAEVLRDIGSTAAIGIVCGAAGALACGPLLRSLLYGVAPSDFVTFAVVPFVLACVSIGAALRPALRAARADPLVALRQE